MMPHLIENNVKCSKCMDRCTNAVQWMDNSFIHGIAGSGYLSYIEKLVYTTFIKFSTTFLFVFDFGLVFS